MSSYRWELLNADEDVPFQEVSIDCRSVPGCPGEWSVRTRTLSGGKREGVQVVEVDTGAARWWLLPTRGLNVWRGWSGDGELGWRSPVRGPVHPAFVPLYDPSGLGWLEGFDELLVRCGLESNGAPDFDADGRLKYPLHGRIGNTPAHTLHAEVDSEKRRLRIIAEMDEVRFHFQKLRLVAAFETEIGSTGFTLHDRLVNLSESPAEAQLLYHPNFGAPLLDAGAQLVVPAKTVVPRNARAAEGVATWSHYAAPQAGFEEQVYFFELYADRRHWTTVLLKNAHGTEGVRLDFDVRRLPCFTQWKNTTALSDGYVTGIEPGTNFPNPRSFETAQGRVVRLDPRGAAEFVLKLKWLRSPGAVSDAERRVRAIRGDRPTTVHRTPQPGWCVDA
ncbi:MAG: DUF4432 family protein [Planctomycetota bacterium]|nr:MAG: DUF4432 family protein [Planctomycetota bacterium]